jgi:hypothetical protein
MLWPSLATSSVWHPLDCGGVIIIRGERERVRKDKERRNREKERY